MVYAISYRPKPDSYPNARLVGGDTDKLELEDTSSDGGVGINTSRYFSGRRLRTDHAPTHVLWLSKRKLQDFESTRMRNVSARLRDLIEQIEPGVHQFIPVEFVTKDGEHLENRWFWQVCNRLDTVHREKTNWTLKKDRVWFPPEGDEPRLVFDLSRIGRAKFWHDKHRTEGPYVSDDVKQTLEAARIAGIHYRHYDQA